jgi:hypothetical protein
MKVSLSRANKIRDKLFDFIRSKSDNITVSVMVPHDLHDTFAAEQVSLESSLEEEIKVIAFSIDLYVSLKVLIATQNHDEVNGLLADIHGCSTIISVYEKILHEIWTKNGPTNIDHKIAASKRTLENSSISGRNPTISVSQGVIDKIQKTLGSEKLNKERYTEQRNRSNFTQTVTLPDVMVSFLKEHQII